MIKKQPFQVVFLLYETIKSQFTKDLGKMNDLGDVKWKKKKKGVNQSVRC